MKILNDELENTTTCRCDHVNTGQLKELILKYSEAKAVDSLYAICILGIGVFTPELFYKKYKGDIAWRAYFSTPQTNAIK